MTEVPKILVSMTCPACGGQVQCEEGEELVICKFCDAVLALTSDEGSAKVMYKLTVSKDQALTKAKAWMKKGPKSKDLDKLAEITESYPIYLPFWRLTGRGKSCVCGEVEEKRGAGKNEVSVWVPKEALINREYIFSDIACDAGDLGITSVRIPKNAQAVNFDSESIVTFGVTKSRDDALLHGSKMIKDEAEKDGASEMDRVSFSKSFFFPKAFTLIYYPFWIIRYKFEDRDYFAAIDGITGETVSGRAPGNAGSQSTAAGIGGALSGAAVGMGIAGTFILDMDVGPIAIGIIAAVAIMSIFYKRFRYGDEILEGAVKGVGLKTKKAKSKVETLSSGSFDYRN